MLAHVGVVQYQIVGTDRMGMVQYVGVSGVCAASLIPPRYMLADDRHRIKQGSCQADRIVREDSNYGIPATTATF